MISIVANTVRIPHTYNVLSLNRLTAANGVLEKRSFGEK